MIRASTAKVLSFSHAAFILGCIPIARPIQNWVGTLLQARHLDPIYLYVLGGISVLLCLSRYYRRLAELRTRTWASLHLLSLIPFLAAFFTLIVEPIELAHIFFYGMFGILAWLSFRESPPRTSLIRALSATAALGLIDELLQGLHPLRVFDPADIVLNLFSGGLGLLLYLPFADSFFFRTKPPKYFEFQTASQV